MPADKSVEGRIRRLARIAMVAVVVGGLFAIAYLHASSAATRAKEAARAARGVAACLNTQLEQRNTPSARDAQAHVDYASAQKKYAASFSALLATIATNQPQAAKVKAFRAFSAQATAVAHATSVYVDVLLADQAYRNAHPLGSC